MKDYSYSYDISKKLAQRKNMSKPKRRTRGINKTEAKLGNILGNRFKYTGDGTKIIDRKIPDFVNEAERIIVEMYGTYWHRNETIQKTLERINIFKLHGYNTIIVWENEIDPNIIKRKLGMLIK